MCKINRWRRWYFSHCSSNIERDSRGNVCQEQIDSKCRTSSSGIAKRTGAIQCIQSPGKTREERDRRRGMLIDRELEKKGGYNGQDFSYHWLSLTVPSDHRMLFFERSCCNCHWALWFFYLRLITKKDLTLVACAFSFDESAFRTCSRCTWRCDEINR